MTRPISTERCRAMLALISRNTNGLPIRRAIDIHMSGSRTCERSRMHWLHVLNCMLG